MPFFKIPMRRRRTVASSGSITIEAPTLGDAYLAAAFDMPEAEVRKQTDWHGPVEVLQDELFVEEGAGEV